MMTLNILRNSLLAAPGLLSLIWVSSASALTTPSAIAEAQATSTTQSQAAQVQPFSEQAKNDNGAIAPLKIAQIADQAGDAESDSVSQVTSVSQLSDVKPTDWAFQALQSLVERYGCIVGYPDKTYRGYRALSRYEFAAGVNACMDRINELLTASLSNFVRKEDLLTIQRLQEEFAAELSVLRGRIDALDARTATLEKQQFSTTTKLVGEAIFNISDIFGRQVGDANNTVFQDRVRLDLLSSFSGKDLLTTRLSAGNFEPFQVPPNTISFVTGRGTAEGVPAFAVDNGTGNSVFLSRLDYTFPIGERLRVFVAATGGRIGYYAYNTVNPYFEDFDGGNGAISAFGQESPIYRIGGGAGLALNLALDPGKKFVLAGGYLASNAATPLPKAGLFNGDYTAFGQLTVTPADWFQLGLTYVNAYHTAGNSIFNLGFDNNDAFTGTVAANSLHTGLSGVIAGLRVPALTNSYGAEASFKFSPRFAINLFGGFTALRLINTGDGEIWYYGLGLAFPDLFKKGNLGGIIVGREPYLGGVTVGGAIPAALGIPGSANLRRLLQGNDASIHVEAFYKFQITNNISITPGIVWITNPDQNAANDDFVIGTIRTTFNF